VLKDGFQLAVARNRSRRKLLKFGGSSYITVMIDATGSWDDADCVGSLG
jgi:hypothetical protein